MSTTFAGLGLPADLVAALAREGINEPFPIQALTIPDALAGRDICGKAKTGSGKTLAFGLPLLGRIGQAEPGHPRALVLVPTRELANQVTDCAAPARRRRATARSRPSTAACRWTRRSPRCGRASTSSSARPGASSTSWSAASCRSADVEVLVIDEADRMADMGFMPQVQKILYRHAQSDTRRCCSPPRSTARSSGSSTATWTIPVQHEVDGDRAHGRGDGPPCSSSSTRWTR